MTADFFTPDQRARAIDVTALENALTDILVKAEEAHLFELGLKKGTMQLVDTFTQLDILKRVGGLKPEVELGGSAANALRGMAMLGARTSYSSAVGTDTYGKAFSDRLEQLSILNRLAVVNDDHTGTCLVLVTPDAERTLNTHLGACQAYRKEFVPVEDIKKSKIFFTTGYVWDTPGQIEAVEFALDVAKKNGAKIALDVADPFVVSRSGDTIRKHLAGTVDIFFANAEGAHMLVGCRGEAAAKIIGEKVEIAVVKDGGNGAFVARKGRITHVPAVPTTVVDTTGAGDMFAGGFLYGLTRGLPIETCGRIAALLASDTISKMGVRLSADLPNRVKALIS